MTTIAYRDGVMAGDGRETVDIPNESPYTIRDNCVKVHKLPDGSLYGAAHASEDIERLLRALRKGKKPPKLTDISAILVDPRGRVWLYEGNIWVQGDLPYYAVGSGAPLALAAMDAGADAIRAVEIGTIRDPFSGGPVVRVALNQVSRQKGRS